VKRDKQLSLFIVLCTLGLILLYPRGNEESHSNPGAKDEGGQPKETKQKVQPGILNAVSRVTNRYAKNTDHQTAEREYWDRQNRIACWSVRLSIFTFVVAVIAAVFAGLAYHQTKRQADAGIEGNSINREAFTSVQRAFVTIVNFDMSARIETLGEKIEAKYWWITPNVKNNGNTPTKNLRYIADSAGVPNGFNLAVGQTIQLGSPGLPGDPQDLLKTNTPTVAAVIGRQATIAVGGIGVTEAFFKTLEPMAPLFFFGIIQYNDIFPESKHHTTKYCYQIRAIVSDKGELSPSSSFCPHWNCADDECDDDRKAYDAEIAAEALKNPFPRVPLRPFPVPPTPPTPPPLSGTGFNSEPG
jgi:hypothetical protein